KELMRLLRNGHEDAEAFSVHVRQQNQTARELLLEAEALANLEPEDVLVRQVAGGLKKYLQDWNRRGTVAGDKTTSYDAALADHLERAVLAPCIDLRKYNMEQVEKSDRQNRAFGSALLWGLLAMGLGGPLGGLALGYTVARRLNHSIAELSVRVRDAAGRLNRELGSVIVEESWGLAELHRHLQHVIKEIERVVNQLQQREHEVLRAEQLAAVGQV